SSFFLCSGVVAPLVRPSFPTRRSSDLVGIEAVGHRVVHGGPNHAAPAVVDDALMAELEALSPFAPLHQPHNLAGIRAAITAFPGDRKSTRLNSSHVKISYAVFCLKKKK